MKDDLDSHTVTDADLIWNRAALDDGGACPAPGDHALSSLLSAHGLTMNGGVLHAVELLDETQWAAALHGYEFFGFDETVLLLTRARKIFEGGENLGDYEQKLDLEYMQYIPNDSALALRFEQYFASHPQDFAPP